MKTLTLLAVTVVVFMQTGCVFVRPKAATVLKFRHYTGKSEYVSVGFRDAKWAVVDGKVTLVGYPRFCDHFGEDARVVITRCSSPVS